MKFFYTLLFLTQVQYVSAQVIDKNLSVHPGCALPPTTFGRSVYIDSVSGDTLQKAIDQKRVLPGDRVVVRGPQGKLRMSRYSHPEWVGSSDFLKVIGSNASFESINLNNMSKMHFERVTVSQDSGSLVIIANSENIIFSNSFFNGGLDSSSWDAPRWIAATKGFHSDNSRCISLVRSKLLNLRDGISFTTRGKTIEDDSIRGLISRNEIRNISGDFIRHIGSDIIVLGNKGYDGYVDAKDGDGNHDDFIQGFALNGVPYENVKIIDNFFQEYTSSDRKYKSNYQGISVFDGEYNNFVIRGNTVIGGAYHGIAMLGGNNGLIENNTVISNYPDLKRKFWIYAGPTKNGVHSSNITVRNNLANHIIIKTNVNYENNATAIPSEVANHVRIYTLENFKYDLRIKYSSPYYGKNIGDATPW